MALDRVPFCAAILAFGVIMYVLLDGFDLGLGLLFPFAAAPATLALMLHSWAPTVPLTAPCPLLCRLPSPAALPTGLRDWAGPG